VIGQSGFRFLPSSGHDYEITMTVLALDKEINILANGQFDSTYGYVSFMFSHRVAFILVRRWLLLLLAFHLDKETTLGNFAFELCHSVSLSFAKPEIRSRF
jgi:hypothetical protein